MQLQSGTDRAVFDLFYLGEGETVYFDLLDRYKENKRNGGSRKDFWKWRLRFPASMFLL